MLLAFSRLSVLNIGQVFHLSRKKNLLHDGILRTLCVDGLKMIIMLFLIKNGLKCTFVANLQKQHNVQIIKTKIYNSTSRIHFMINSRCCDVQKKEHGNLKQN